jgi:hypothetical protein
VEFAEFVGFVEFVGFQGRYGGETGDNWRLVETDRDTVGRLEIGGCIPSRRGWVADASVGKRGYQVTKRCDG